MDENEKNPTTIDEYIAEFPEEIQKKMQAIRKTIKDVAPDAIERISWRMPTFTQNGDIIHFAGFAKHIGIYPGASGVEFFKDKLTEYKTSKGAIQIPLDKPIPFELISEIVKFRLAENAELAEKKKSKKK